MQCQLFGLCGFSGLIAPGCFCLANKYGAPFVSKLCTFLIYKKSQVDFLRTKYRFDIYQTYKILPRYLLHKNRTRFLTHKIDSIFSLQNVAIRAPADASLPGRYLTF